MNALMVAALLISGVIMPAERLTVTPWGGGLVMDAPTPLAGQYFYDVERATVRMADGSAAEYVTVKRQVYASSYDWEKFIKDNAVPGGLILITCYPKESATAWMMVTFLAPAANVSGVGTISEPAPPKPPYCKKHIVGEIKTL